MLYDKTATVYSKTRNSKMVTSWTLSGTIKCNIQPARERMSFQESGMYNQFILYTPDMTLKNGDKLTLLGEDYIVRLVEMWRGKFSSHLSCRVEKSRGT